MIFLTIGNLVSPPSLPLAGQCHNWLGQPSFPLVPRRFLVQLFFGSNRVLDIFSVFAAALKIQLMSSTSNLFLRATPPQYTYKAAS